MTRRSFLVIFCLCLGAEPRTRKYVFRIRTMSGGIVGNIVIEGRSQPEAESKLRDRYPECTILDVQER